MGSRLWRSLLLAALWGLVVVSCQRRVSVSPQELAFQHAPVHYQDTDDSFAEADFITRLDYDGNWEASDNWENLPAGDLSAVVYYSVVETCTHWYIVYAFYHPRDWTDTIEQEHENDLEGLLAVVEKEGSKYGTLQGLVTIFHTDFFSYVPAGSPLESGHETVDGQLSWQRVGLSRRPKTSQEAEGHGLKAWPFAGNFQGRADQDGVIYFPSKTQSETPASGNDRRVSYQLQDLFAPGGIWDRQLQEADLARSQAATFATWGTLKGDHGGGCGDGVSVCKADAAHLPWAWDDQDDGPVFPGEMALDPAHLAARYFTGPQDFDLHYLQNPYLESLRAAGYGPQKLPPGWPDGLDIEDLFSRLGTTCP